MENDQFWNVLRGYMEPNSRVAEIYHGEKDDLLKGSSKIVGKSGIVYGIDSLNPFSHYPHMLKLQKIPNIRLIKAEIPPLPEEASDLDAIIIREFIWTLESENGAVKVNPETCAEISKSIKNNGYLVLVLNNSEQIQENGNDPFYQQIINRYLPNFSKAYHNGPLIIFQKNK